MSPTVSKEVVDTKELSYFWVGKFGLLAQTRQGYLAFLPCGREGVPIITKFAYFLPKGSYRSVGSRRQLLAETRFLDKKDRLIPLTQVCTVSPSDIQELSYNKVARKFLTDYPTGTVDIWHYMCGKP